MSSKGLETAFLEPFCYLVFFLRRFSFLGVDFFDNWVGALSSEMPASDID